MLAGGSKHRAKYRFVMCTLSKGSICEAASLFTAKAKGQLGVSSQPKRTYSENNNNTLWLTAKAFDVN